MFKAFRGSGITGIKARSDLTKNFINERNVLDPKIIEILSVTPRHIFIDEALQRHAYEDVVLPIGYGQTISPPSLVAEMISIAANGKHCERVLEIGTGCGYQTAILAQLFNEVYSVERIEPLLKQAQNACIDLSLASQVRFYHEDGFKSDLFPRSFFDAIIISAASEHLPFHLKLLLARHGRLVAPVGDDKEQRLISIVFNDKFIEKDHGAVRFVPVLRGTK